MRPRFHASRSASAGLAAVLVLTVAGGCRSLAGPARATAAPAAPAAPAKSTAPTASAPVVPPSVPEPPASPAPASPVAAPYKNTVRWSTASEVDSFGFDVFRGESEAGPFVRLNPRPIAGAGTSDESHAYSFVDDTIDPSRDYFYYVESISIEGEREKFTPVIRARAKTPPAPSPAP